MSQNPLFIDPVIGYRSWRFNSEFDLQSSVIRPRQIWPCDEKCIAHCAETQFRVLKEGTTLVHESPCEGCTCGLYGYHDKGTALDAYGRGAMSVTGVAIYWGKVCVGPIGFKAQYARPVALTDKRNPHAATNLDWRAIVEGVVEKYSIPLLKSKELGEYAEQFGKPLGATYLDDIPD